MFAATSAAALALSGGYSVSAQDYDKSGYCPITKGMTLEYVNYDADGARMSSFIMKVSAVEGTLSKGTVTFDQYFYDADGKPLFSDNGGNLPMEVTVGGPEGTVSRMSDVGKVMKVQDIMSKGDASSVRLPHERRGQGDEGPGHHVQGRCQQRPRRHEGRNHDS